MTARRKQTTTGTKQPPNNIPPYYSYPQYGYGSPPYYNPVYTYPVNSYNNTEYSYYPLNEYGQIIGPPTSYPPVSSRYYQDYYPYTDYNIPPDRSYMPSPRRDRTLYDDYYYYPHSDHRYEKPRRETLPPIQKHVFISFLNLFKINISFLS
jgi:hypothetical protein